MSIEDQQLLRKKPGHCEVLFCNNTIRQISIFRWDDSLCIEHANKFEHSDFVLVEDFVFQMNKEDREIRLARGETL